MPSINNTAQNFEISRVLGKGRSNQSVALVIPSAEQLSLLSQNKPVIVILASLTSEKDVGADRILGVAIGRMAELFYENKERSVLKRMEDIAKEAQYILAELFFKDGLKTEPFKVILDLGMISMVNGVYFVYIDGKIRMWVVRKQKVVEISSVYRKEGEERLKGSGRWLFGDKLILATEGTNKADVVVKQLMTEAVSQEAIVRGLEVLSSNEGIVIISWKVPEVITENLELPNEERWKKEEKMRCEHIETEGKEEKVISSVLMEKKVEGGWAKKLNFFAHPTAYIREKLNILKFKTKSFLNKFPIKLPSKAEKVEGEEQKVICFTEEKTTPVQKKQRAEDTVQGKMADEDYVRLSVERRATKGFSRKRMFSGWTSHTLRDWSTSIGFLFSHILNHIARGRRRRIVKTNGTERRRLVKGAIGLLIVISLCFLIWKLITNAFNERKNRENYNKEVVAIDAKVKWLEEHKSDDSFTIDDRLGRIDQVRASIATLHSNPLAEQSKIDSWITRLQSVEDFLTKTIPVTQVDVLSDLAIQYDFSKPIDIDVRDDEVFVLDAGTKRVYTVNLLTKSTQVYAECSNCTGLEKIAWSQNHLFVFDSQKGLFEVLTDKTFKAVAGISIFGTPVTEFSTYLDNVYFLLREKRSIIKSIPVRNGYSVGQEYNRSPLPAGAEDMVINGYIFVCTSSGEVKKYELGQEVPFHISGLRTPFGPTCSIDTVVPKGDEKNYIYLFDSAEKRIVVINKDDSDGNSFVAQMVYRGDPMWLKNVKEISLSDDGKYLILLDGTAILRINLTPVLNATF